MSLVNTMTVNYKPSDDTRFLLKELVKLSGVNDMVTDKKSDHNELVLCLFALIKDAREKGKDLISNLSEVLNKSEDEKQKSFYTVMYSLFDDGIKWSRIIVAFMYIIEVLRISKSEYNKYFEWSVNIISEIIDPWVEKNGGWNQLVVISKSKHSAEEVNDNIKRISTVILGITGLVAFGKWLFN